MKNQTFKIILSVFLMIHASVCYSASFFFQIHNFASASDLLQSHLSNAQQDRMGFMWFATWNGLVRYDGYNVYTFKPILNSNGSISSNRIYNIKMSSTGDVWCLSSDNKLYSFNRKTCAFTDVLKELNISSKKKVKVLTPMKNGVTWVTFKDFSCLRLVDSSYKKSFVFFPARSNKLLNSSKINCIEKDKMGREWILTDKGAACLNRGIKVKGSFYFLETIRGATCLLTADGFAVFVSDNGHRSQPVRVIGDGQIQYLTSSGSLLVAATSKGVFLYDLRSASGTKLTQRDTKYLYVDSKKRVWAFSNTREVDMINLHDMHVRHLFADFMPQSKPMKNPQLIYETSSHQIILKPENGRFSYYDEQTQTLKNCIFYKNNAWTDYTPKEINKYLIDVKGNLWIIQSHQADCISFNLWKFNQWNNPFEQESRAILMDHLHRQWITDRSLSLYIMRNGESMGYVSKDGLLQKNPVTFSAMPVYSMAEDKSHRLWLGTKGDGLFLLTPKDLSCTQYHVEHFTHQTLNPGSLCSDSIYAIHQDRHGRMWFGSYGSGIFTAEKRTDGWRFRCLPGFIRGAKVRCISEGANDVLMIGTADGLVTADIRNINRPKYYLNAFRKEEWGLKGNDIMNIIKCNRDIYVCVYGSGVSKIVSTNLLTDSLHFRNYLIASTAAADQIKTAASDGRFIWLVSDRSLVCFYPHSGVYSIYDHNQFIDDVNFSEASPIVDRGRMTVGTSKGLLWFMMNNTQADASKKRIVFTGIRYQNNLAITPLNDIQELTISPDERSFSLFVSSLNFNSIIVERYRYKMEGIDKGWTYTGGNQPTVTYNNLPSGSYRLIVQVADENGLWTSSKEIQVYVIPLFVETVWFYVMILLLIIAAVAGMIYAIIYFRRMRNLVQKKYSLLMSVDKYVSTKVKEEVQKPETDDADDSEQFLKNTVVFFNDNISNSNLVVEDFARNQGMSRTAYYNKMKAITGLSPIDFIKQMRIKKAVKLLDEGCLSVADVAYRVGFTDQKYFSKCFKAEMNMSPTQYLHQKKSGQGI